MIQKFNVFCEPAGEDRRIHLYLPDDYHQSAERYAVLYMFDGHNLYFDSDATFGKSLGGNLGASLARGLFGTLFKS